MVDYPYDKLTEICIPKLRDDINASAMTDKSFVRVKNLNRIDIGEPTEHYTFDVEFQNTLSAGDEIILDGLVAGAIGYKVVFRNYDGILYTILDSASGAPQNARLVDFFDQYGGSFQALIIAQKYSAARGRADAAETAEVLESADVTLIYDAVPADTYEAI